jgi:hypothetical protein
VGAVFFLFVGRYGQQDAVDIGHGHVSSGVERSRRSDIKFKKATG